MTTDNQRIDKNMTTDNQRLNGRIALVTGASRGLGLEIARTFIRQGATVIMTARDTKGLHAAAEALGPQAIGMAADVGDSGQVAVLFSMIKERFGRLDVLVNNAALGIPARIEDTSDEVLHAQIHCNLYGPILCIRAAVPLMRAAGGGEIISVSSESVNLPFPLLAVYAATKAGLEALSKGLRGELGPDNIRVSVLRAGTMANTTFGAAWTPEQQKTAFELWGRTGHLAMVGHQGGGVQPSVIANTILDMATLASSGSIDLIELRAR